MELEQIIFLHMFQLINRYIMAHLHQWSQYFYGINKLALILQVVGISLYLFITSFIFIGLIYIVIYNMPCSKSSY